MFKIGAIVAVAALAGTATADSFASSPCATAGSGLAQRCHGPTAEWRKPCCTDDLQCVMKDDNYGACRPVTRDIPAGWDGTILFYGETDEDFDEDDGLPGMEPDAEDEYDEDDDDLDEYDEDDEDLDEYDEDDGLPPMPETDNAAISRAAITVTTTTATDVEDEEFELPDLDEEEEDLGEEDETLIPEMEPGADGGQCAETGRGNDNQCHGNDPSLQRPCCDPMSQCVQKDEFYGQCRDITEAIPSSWMGTILSYDFQASMDEVAVEDILSTPAVRTPVVTTTATTTTATPAAEDVPLLATNDVYIAYVGKDYIPNSVEGNEVAVEDIVNGSRLVANQIECERFCSATEGCTAASFYENPVGGKNCWLKDIAAVACTLPTDASDDTEATLLMLDTCMPESEKPPSKYTAYAGQDYIPNAVVPNLVTVVDIPLPEGAKEVASQAECEHICTLTMGCNAASFYNELVGGHNCWLKTIADVCTIPTDAIADPKATLLLQSDPTCPGAAVAAAAPATAPGAVAAAEGVVDPLVPLTATDAADAELDDLTGAISNSANDITSTVPITEQTSTTPTATPPSSGAGSVCSALVAIVAVGAVAVL